jgi:hypothetical protein
VFEAFDIVDVSVGFPEEALRQGTTGEETPHPSFKDARENHDNSLPDQGYW